MNSNLPVVLAFAGHDPSGGAGIQADIETLASHGCHAATVVTALTVQDTRDVSGFTPVEAIHVITQARAILEDMPVATIKLGMLGSVENAEVIHTILADYPEIPVVFDPVLAAGSGSSLVEYGLTEAIRSLLLPETRILTPNSLEARELAPEADTLGACALALLDQGVDYVLVTGSHEPSSDVINRLYHDQHQLDSFSWERLPHNYHGSGCTLAAAIAAQLALGREPVAAIRTAQAFTWQALRQGYRPGLGQHLPNRCPSPRNTD
jgi:hydroxymethylpyrimidine/phosphomethylpyrimidine kinase